MPTITQLDSLEHDTSDGRQNAVLKIDSTHFVTAHSASFNCYITSFEIDGSYQITELSQITHLSGGSEVPGIPALLLIDSTHFMLAQFYNNNILVKTFSLDGSYAVTEIDSFTAHVSHANSDVVALCALDDHFVLASFFLDIPTSSGIDISILEIDGSYIISRTSQLTYVDDSLNTYSYTVALAEIDTTHFILSYSNLEVGLTTSVISTFSVDGSFNITEEDSFEHTTNASRGMSFLKIDSTHFLLAYEESPAGAWLKTFSIDGSFLVSQIASFEHDTNAGNYESIVNIDTSYYVVAYSGGSNDGFIRLIYLDSSYIPYVHRSLEHDTTNGQWNSLAAIDTEHVFLAYSGSGTDGFVKTFEITYDTEARANINVI